MDLPRIVEHDFNIAQENLRDVENVKYERE